MKFFRVSSPPKLKNTSYVHLEPRREGGINYLCLFINLANFVETGRIFLLILTCTLMYSQSTLESFDL